MPVSDIGPKDHCILGISLVIPNQKVAKGSFRYTDVFGERWEVPWCIAESGDGGLFLPTECNYQQNRLGAR
jgi:hypothetical protein